MVATMNKQRAFASGVRSFRMGQGRASCYLKRTEHRIEWVKGWEAASRESSDFERGLHRALKACREHISRSGCVYVFLNGEGKIKLRSVERNDSIERMFYKGFHLVGYYQKGAKCAEIREDILITRDELSAVVKALVATS